MRAKFILFCRCATADKSVEQMLIEMPPCEAAKKPDCAATHCIEKGKEVGTDYADMVTDNKEKFDFKLFYH